MPGVDAFDSPFGPVEIDDDVRRTVAGSAGVVIDDHPHQGSTPSNASSPFLRRALGSRVTVLPVDKNRT